MPLNITRGITFYNKTMADEKGKYAYNYLLSKGLSPVAAAGIIGNLHAESGLNTRIPGRADDKGSIGIAQWHSERKQGLYDFAKKQGTNAYNLDTQLDYLVEELKSPAYKKALLGVSNAKTPDEAAVAFMNDFEKPAEWAKKQSVGQRVGMARSIFSGTPYQNINYQEEKGQGELGYGVDTSLNLPINTGDYQTAPDIASKEDLEAEQAKIELIQKQKEKNFLAEVQNRQEQGAERRQQEQEQYQQQQQDTGIDPAYYQMPQIALPEYVSPQQMQQQPQFQVGGELDMYKEGGGIPERYKNMGFTHVGQKKEGDGQKKWKVLAKKGDKYKVVQGGYRGMQDFSQHKSKQRQDNFWSRMGGKNSAKAQDPFSPLYWHKRLGKWEDGGEIKGEVECSNCGWSWDKKDSSEEDMYNCHKCGGKNTGVTSIANSKFQVGGFKLKDERDNLTMSRETIPETRVNLPPQLNQNTNNTPTIEQLMVMRPDLTKDQGIFYGTGDDTTYVSPGGKLEEVVIQNNYKNPAVKISNKRTIPSEYREKPVEIVRDAIPELEKFAKKYAETAIHHKEKIEKEEAMDSILGQKAMKIKLSNKATLEDTIENKDIDLAKYKNKEQAVKLQKFLVGQGYNLDPEGKFGNSGIDGKIGNVTKSAVSKYNQHLATVGYDSVKEGTGLLGKCTETQCSEYGQNELYRNMQPKVSREDWNKTTGLQGSAWEIGKNIVKAGGKEVRTKDGLKPGDVVTMYTGGLSAYQGEADKAGTGTTHTGIIDKINPDGSYYILHNVHSGNKEDGFEGKEYRDLVKNNITGTHNFTVKHAFRPDYGKVKKGEVKIVREDLNIKVNPTKEKILSTGDYNNFFTMGSAKQKLETNFIKPLNDSKNKKIFSKVFNLGDDEYSSLAKISLGILGQEAAYGTNPYYTTGAKRIAATGLKAVGYKEDEVSKGAGRLKYETNFGKDALTEFGIDEDNFDDENNVALTTMYKLAGDYKKFLKQGDSKKDAMYKAITTYNSSLGRSVNGKTIEEFAKDYDVDYTNKVLNFSNMFDIADNKKSYRTTSDELLTQPNVAKWDTKLKKQNKT